VTKERRSLRSAQLFAFRDMAAKPGGFLTGARAWRCRSDGVRKCGQASRDSIGVMPLLQGHKRPCRLLKTRDVTQALTVAGGARPDIAYFSMSAVGVFRVALTGRIERLGPPEARARVRAIEEPYFEECRQRFFALDQFPENADRFAITYADVYDEVANRAGQRAT